MTPPRRCRRRWERRLQGCRCGFAAGAGALAALAILAGACTISSESPDAASLSGRSGPASGTTTTAGDGGEAPRAEEPSEQAPETAGDETATDDGTGPSPDEAGAAPTADDGAGDAPDDAETAEGAAGGQPQDAADDPAGTAGESTGTGTVPAEEATTDPPEGGSETGNGVPATDTDPAADTTGTPTIAETAFDERSKVSTVGIGSVYFGMSPEESAERVGTVWAGVPAGGADCYVITPANGPPGVSLWVYHGTIERVDIDTPLLRTQSGLGVGTHLGELRSRLGEKLVVEDHPYLPGWTLATFVPTDPNDAAFRIAFDISGGEVIRFRAGRTEIVARESCA